MSALKCPVLFPVATALLFSVVGLLVESVFQQTPRSLIALVPTTSTSPPTVADNDVMFAASEVLTNTPDFSTESFLQPAANNPAAKKMINNLFHIAKYFKLDIIKYDLHFFIPCC